MPIQKVYIVEDDENIRDLVKYALESAGFEAFGFERGKDFFAQLTKEKPALVLLDIMLPGQDGLAILAQIRHRMKKLPVIMLTAKGSEYERVRGLDLGADDYITKPFSVLELIARIKAVLRRSESERPETILSFQNIILDNEKHLVMVDDRPITLTLKEFELLNYLLINQEIVLDREKITEKIWGFDRWGESRTVDMHIKSLRRKLGSAGVWIKTVRGIGYKIGA